MLTEPLSAKEEYNNPFDSAKESSIKPKRTILIHGNDQDFSQPDSEHHDHFSEDQEFGAEDEEENELLLRKESQSISKMPREEIIDEKKLIRQISKNKGAGQLSRLFTNLTFYIIHEIFVKMIICLAIINFYEDPRDNFQYLFLFLAIDNFLKSIFLVYLFRYHPVQMREFDLFKIDLVCSFSNISVNIGCFLYLSQLISLNKLGYFLIPNFLGFYGILPRLRSKSNMIFNLLWMFLLFEPLQNLLIVLNFLYFKSTAWSFIFGYYYLQSTFALILGSIIGLLSIVFIGLYIFKTQNIIAESIIFFFFGSAAFYAIWTGFFYFFTFLGMRSLLIDNEIPRFSTSQHYPHRFDLLYTSSIEFIFYGFANLFWVIFAYCSLKNRVIKYLLTNERFWTISKFGVEINLMMKFMSDSYFSKKDKQEKKKNEIVTEEKITIAKNALTECIICYETNADILIEPCGHSGICQKCLKNSFRMSNICPFCPKKISSCKIIGYDEDRRAFVVKGILEDDESESEEQITKNN